MSIDFIVVDGVKVESIIGLDLLEKLGCIIDLQESALYTIPYMACLKAK